MVVEARESVDVDECGTGIGVAGSVEDVGVFGAAGEAGSEAAGDGGVGGREGGVGCWVADGWGGDGERAVEGVEEGGEEEEGEGGKEEETEFGCDRHCRLIEYD